MEKKVVLSLKETEILLEYLKDKSLDNNTVKVYNRLVDYYQVAKGHKSNLDM